MYIGGALHASIPYTHVLGLQVQVTQSLGLRIIRYMEVTDPVQAEGASVTRGKLSNI